MKWLRWTLDRPHAAIGTSMNRSTYPIVSSEFLAYALELELCARVPSVWTRSLKEGFSMLPTNGDVQTMEQLDWVLQFSAVLPERCTSTTIEWRCFFCHCTGFHDDTTTSLMGG